MKFPVQAKLTGWRTLIRIVSNQAKSLCLFFFLSVVLVVRLIFLVMRDECMNLKLYICKYNYMIMTHA